jgi:hypothetical protein
MQIAYEMLPESFKGIRKMETLEGKGRTGVFRKTNGNPRYFNAEMKVRKYPMSKSIGYF